MAITVILKVVLPVELCIEGEALGVLACFRKNYIELLTRVVFCFRLVNKKIALREENSERRMGCLDESLKMFKRLHSQLPENLEVICEVS